jgi:hypothetical protein
MLPRIEILDENLREVRQYKKYDHKNNGEGMLRKKNKEFF